MRLPEKIAEYRTIKVGDIDEVIDHDIYINYLKEIGKDGMLKTVNIGDSNRALFFVFISEILTITTKFLFL